MAGRNIPQSQLELNSTMDKPVVINGIMATSSFMGGLLQNYKIWPLSSNLVRLLEI